LSGQTRAVLTRVCILITISSVDFLVHGQS
jgi:hypothetical protein